MSWTLCCFRLFSTDATVDTVFVTVSHQGWNKLNFNVLSTATCHIRTNSWVSSRHHCSLKTTRTHAHAHTLCECSRPIYLLPTFHPTSPQLLWPSNTHPTSPHLLWRPNASSTPHPTSTRPMLSDLTMSHPTSPRFTWRPQQPQLTTLDLPALYLTSPRPVWPHIVSPDRNLTFLRLTWPHHASPDLTTLHLTWPSRALPDLTTPRLTSPRIISLHLTFPRSTWPYHASPGLTTSHLSTPDLPALYLTSPRLISAHLTFPRSTWPHHVSPDLSTPDPPELYLTSSSPAVHTGPITATAGVILAMRLMKRPPPATRWHRSPDGRSGNAGRWQLVAGSGAAQ